MSLKRRKRPVRVLIHSLGCAKNFVDSESLAVRLRAAGLETVGQLHRADVVIVNTCGFMDDAKLESIHVLLEAVRWKAAGRGRRIYAMGCLAQRDGYDLAAELPELDGVFGIGDWPAMIEAIGCNPVVDVGTERALNSLSCPAGPASAYLRISDGCSHGCAFCSIPQMRGLYRSEPMEAVVCEAERLVDGGVKELILIGQETTSYGVDLYRKRKLTDLCGKLAALEGVQWIRILYAHPPSMPASYLEELAAVPCVLPYLDYPIEHASDRMLKLMNRRTTAQRMREAIDRFRDAAPGACVRTTVMVGFPGETDDDFRELYGFMENVRFERAGVFVYSPQEDTPGVRLPERVPGGVALDRLDQLMKLQKSICLEKHRELVGHRISVLIEKNTSGTSWGRSEWDAPEIDCRVRVGGKYAVGDLIELPVAFAAAYRIHCEAHRDEDLKKRMRECLNSEQLHSPR